MDRDTNVKVAMTAGILSVILLFLAGCLLVFNNSNDKDDDSELDKNITEYAGSSQESSEIDVSAMSLTAATVSSTDSTVSGNSFYMTKGVVFKDIYKGVEYNLETQLNEMYVYWSENNMAAVSDLAHLERYEAMSYSLNYINDFYYYGDTDSEGKPNGKGLAVYKDDCYYFGDWVNGVRQGTGAWINFYPSYSNYVVTEHSYLGAWENDLPTGEGQEHYDYNPEYMNEEDIYLQNAIGIFKDGKYDGEMYIIIIDPDGYTTEWVGNCKEGNWSSVENASNDEEGKIPVLSRKSDSDEHIYMSEEGLSNNGIGGIVTGGKPVDK